jgi:hypothetical protein
MLAEKVQKSPVSSFGCTQDREVEYEPLLSVEIISRHLVESNQ